METHPGTAGFRAVRCAGSESDLPRAGTLPTVEPRTPPLVRLGSSLRGRIVGLVAASSRGIPLFSSLSPAAARGSVCSLDGQMAPRHREGRGRPRRNASPVHRVARRDDLGG